MVSDVQETATMAPRHARMCKFGAIGGASTTRGRLE